MTTDLKFTGATLLTICDVSEGDMYHLVAQAPTRYAVVDAIFSGTAGRELKTVGRENSDLDSYMLHFASAGARLCRIIKTTRADMLTFITAVNTFILNEDNLIGTVAWTDGSATGMKMDFAWRSAPISMGDLRCYVDFEVVFTRYTPP